MREGGQMGFIFFALMLAYGVAQIYAGFLGIEHFWGGLIAGGIIVVSIFTRITLPITIGSFLGALYVWEWHWAIALLFAAPGIVFMIPAFVAQWLGNMRPLSPRD